MVMAKTEEDFVRLFGRYEDFGDSPKLLAYVNCIWIRSTKRVLSHVRLI